MDERLSDIEEFILDEIDEFPNTLPDLVYLLIYKNCARKPRPFTQRIPGVGGMAHRAAAGLIEAD